jgi:hypothetical protein
MADNQPNDVERAEAWHAPPVVLSQFSNVSAVAEDSGKAVIDQSEAVSSQLLRAGLDGSQE